MFDDEEQLQYCMGVAEEAKEVLQAKIEEKRKLARKEGKTTIEEDDPVKVHGEAMDKVHHTSQFYYTNNRTCQEVSSIPEKRDSLQNDGCQEATVVSPYRGHHVL